eukprot:CAMPEP_0116016898 /NCGR_PEP_ID=MMETSP0321-20121206/7740_1 /TAXON_ID=163516 /ORGANISM="Leptocylindrus danicus var. danicus, Strain B650" /LENGTH=318 /DNA_ID=CAMNT_0003487015 /DNA_START=845 /DNA_END=1801 /DNA_ORIENTATION=+
MNWPGSKKKSSSESNPNKRKPSDTSTLAIGGDDDNRIINGKKRAIDPGSPDANTQKHENFETDDFGCDLNIDDLPCDTLLAVRSLVQRGFCITSTFSHVVLRHMIHEVLDGGRGTASTTIEKELEQLRVSNHLRFIQFISHREDVAIVETDEYTKEIRHAIMFNERLPESHREQLVHMFLFMLKNHCRSSIRYEDLLTSIREWKELERDSVACTAKEAIDCFLSIGILKERRENRIASKSYWFSIPNIDSLIASLIAGRKEIMTRVQRKMYKEISRGVLERSNLRSSVLPVPFHVKDLLCKGQLRVKNTPSGEFIQLV